MNTIQFIQSSLFEIFRSFLGETAPLAPEELLFKPTHEANSIAFLLWHFPRIAETAFHRVSPIERNSTIWERDNWHEKFGLGKTDTGTGFTPDQVGAFHPDKALLTGYLESVQKALDDGLSLMTPEHLDQPVTPENPQATVGRLIQSVIIGHGYFHLGEVRFLKGLQGRPFPR